MTIKRWKLFNQKRDHSYISILYELTCICGAAMNEYYDELLTVQASIRAIEKYQRIFNHVNDVENSLFKKVNKSTNWRNRSTNETEMRNTIVNNRIKCPKFTMKQFQTLCNSPYLVKISKQFVRE